MRKFVKTKKTKNYTQREDEENYFYMNNEAKELEDKIRHQKIINQFCNKFF